ncbi:unnamed protein product [Blepharisma stoltei]|uniref:Uncharacterized protein n=1 Tax=Blepharisma stoltei TaxID=1481888 RepID=A0AAU9IJM3_9CILI|nr:unnamed protein product [Blepharisma stoltei]
MNTKKLRSLSQGNTVKVDFIKKNKISISIMAKKAKKAPKTKRASHLQGSPGYIQTTLKSFRRSSSADNFLKNKITIDFDEHTSQQEEVLGSLMSPVLEVDSPKSLTSASPNQIIGQNELCRQNMDTYTIDQILESLEPKEMQEFPIEEYELPPTPPNHPPGSIVWNHNKDFSQQESENKDNINAEESINHTPLKSEDPLFRNIEYSGMSLDEQIKRSARRVKIQESGEECPDLTWTEVKLKIDSVKKQRHEEEYSDHFVLTEESDFAIKSAVAEDLMILESNTQACSDDGSQVWDCSTPKIERKSIAIQTDKKELEKGAYLRRSARLAAKRKAMTDLKRKRHEVGGVLSLSALRGSTKKIKK